MCGVNWNMLSKRFKNDGEAHLKLNKLQMTMRDQVDLKVSSAAYSYEQVSCPVCESSEGTVISEKDRYGLAFSVKICGGCGLVRTDPRMTQEAYNSFYNNEYRQLYVGKEVATESFFYTQTRKGKAIISLLNDNSFVQRTNWQDKFVLEVGCGAGGLLHEFKALGAEVVGTDLGEGYINWGKRNKGLDLRVGFLKDVQLDRSPDLIIYSHVMEHILNPLEELAVVKGLCSENSLVYIEVPGIKNIHAAYRHDLLRYLQNAHTWHFSLSSLSNLMRKAGFTGLHGTEYVRSIWKMDETTEQLELNNDHDAVYSYLKRTESTFENASTRLKNKVTQFREKTVGLIKKFKP